MNRIRFTKEGFDKLKNEYDDLLHKRSLAVMDVKKARDMGDLSENGYYKSSKAKLSQIDSKLRRFADYLRKAVVVDAKGNDLIGVGSIVTIFDRKHTLTYEIVGDLEASPTEGKISLLSPIGRAIAGKKVGDEVYIDIPAGKIWYKIKEVKW